MSKPICQCEVPLVGNPPAPVGFFTCRHQGYFVSGVYQRQVETRYSIDTSYSGAFGVGSTVGYHPNKEQVLRMVYKEDDEGIVE